MLRPEVATEHLRVRTAGEPVPGENIEDIENIRGLGRKPMNAVSEGYLEAVAEVGDVVDVLALQLLLPKILHKLEGKLHAGGKGELGRNCDVTMQIFVNKMLMFAQGSAYLVMS